MVKKFAAILAAVILLTGVASGAFAVELPDPERACSVVITMEWLGIPMNGGSVTICQVGELAEVDGTYRFVPVEELEGSGLTLDNLNDPQLAGEMAEAAQSYDLEQMTASIRSGRAEFENLAPGVYVVMQNPEQAVPGFAAIEPFLISLPRWNGTAYDYILNALPKVSPDLDPTVPTIPDPSWPTCPEPSWPTCPTEPSEPTGPSEPTVPTEPTEPFEPTEPTRPSEPTVPEESTEPTEPTETTVPAEPTEPTEPGLPPTGQLRWPVPMLAVCGIALFLFGAVLCFGRKEKHET